MSRMLLRNQADVAARGSVSVGLDKARLWSAIEDGVRGKTMRCSAMSGRAWTHLSERRSQGIASPGSFLMTHIQLCAFCCSSYSAIAIM